MAGELVLKSWRINGEAKLQGQPIIRIEGRQPGFLAFLLNLIGLDPTTRMEIDAEAVYFTGSSAKGQEVRVIPLDRVASTYYGYEKPIELLIVGALLFWTVIAPIACLILYFLNKALTIAVVDQSGVISAIRFKSSVIEGVMVDQKECARVNALIRDLLLAAKRA